jgi:hypothetical protein
LSLSATAFPVFCHWRIRPPGVGAQVLLAPDDPKKPWP